MNLSKVHSVYFIGIGGIGMSALAKWFLANGCQVAGYDRSPSVVTDQLIALGAAVTFEDSVAPIPANYKSISPENLVIYTPAISNTHPQLIYFQTNGVALLKRAQVLGLISQQYKTLAIAGTHGKTTTSCLLAHLLYNADVSMVGFLGGLAQNYDSNFIANIKEGEETYVVVEADEFDRSFLTLHPYLAAVTNVDADHLDIYGTADSVLTAFNDFVSQIQPEGKLFVCSHINELTFHNKSIYGLETADRAARNIRYADGCVIFDYFKNGEQLIAGLMLKLPGNHNITNAVAAISMALEIGISPNKIKEGIASFKGIKRRFEFIYQSDEVVYVDDYAHHPVEINALLQGVKSFWPDKPVTLVFQPHLFSRTRDFMDEFAASLSKADQVLLLEIYPARELPIKGITSEVLLEKITANKKRIITKEAVLKAVSQVKGVLLTVGAGDVDRLVEPVKQALKATTNA